METKPINALITGGAHRVGRAMALDLAANGYGVIIHANSSLDAAQSLCDEINNNGGRAFAVQADLTKSGETKSLMDQAVEKSGSVEILINNASVFEADEIDNLDEELWDTHFNVHVKAPAFLSSSLAHHLGDKEGMIVNMIDQRVWRLNPKFFTYTLSKSALWTATQTMAQALGPNIRVNAIGPGPTLKNERQSDEDFEKQQATLILKNGPDLAEFGSTIRYLWQTKSITGQMLALDGGQHLAWRTPDTRANE